MSKIIRPSGKGAIVNWDTGYCYKCETQFKGCIGLWSHVTRSKNHNKAKIKQRDLSLQVAAKKIKAQKKLDEFLKVKKDYV